MPHAGGSHGFLYINLLSLAKRKFNKAQGSWVRSSGMRAARASPPPQPMPNPSCSRLGAIADCLASQTSCGILQQSIQGHIIIYGARGIKKDLSLEFILIPNSESWRKSFPNGRMDRSPWLALGPGRGIRTGIEPGSHTHA